MGWICVAGDNCQVVSGVWNKYGIAYYSIADDITAIHDAIFFYIQTISMPIVAFILFMVLLMVIIAVVKNVKRLMMQNADG